VSIPPPGAAAHNNGDMDTVRQSDGSKREWRRARRVVVLAAAGVLGLSACRDNGLPDRNLPLQEARHRQYGYPAYQNVAAHAPVAADGRYWAPSLPLETIPERLLVPIGNAGTPLYAVRGAATPYSRLYAPAADGRWQPYLRLN
jgi:hypothetical protein